VAFVIDEDVVGRVLWDVGVVESWDEGVGGVGVIDWRVHEGGRYGQE